MGRFLLISMGKPVVAKRVGGIPETVTDGEDGFLVDYGGHEAFAGRILGLLNDKGLSGRIGENAAKRARKEHDLDANTRLLSEVLVESAKTPGNS